MHECLYFMYGRPGCAAKPVDAMAAVCSAALVLSSSSDPVIVSLPSSRRIRPQKKTNYARSPVCTPSLPAHNSARRSATRGPLPALPACLARPRRLVQRLQVLAIVVLTVATTAHCQMNQWIRVPSRTPRKLCLNTQRTGSDLLSSRSQGVSSAALPSSMALPSAT